MERVAKFEKVSFEEFYDEVTKRFGKELDHMSEDLEGNPSVEYKQNQVRKWYDNIKLPERATSGSAGYDFFAPFRFILMGINEESIVIPTGIRAKIKEGWMLQIYPKSGLGFKYRTRLDNTIPVIDSDYYYSDNEGHIMIKMHMGRTQHNFVTIESGKAFVQGIFIPFGITEDDEATGIRNGGFGSTGK